MKGAFFLFCNTFTVLVANLAALNLQNYRSLSISDIEVVWNSCFRNHLNRQNGKLEDNYKFAVSFVWSSISSMPPNSRTPLISCYTRNEIIQLENVLGSLSYTTLKRRSRVIYSSVDKECSIFHANLRDIEELRGLRQVTSIDPLFPSAKISSNLYAYIYYHENIIMSKNIPSGAQDVPPAIEITLAPGVWDDGLMKTWQSELGRNGKELWNLYLQYKSQWLVPRDNNLNLDQAEMGSFSEASGRLQSIWEYVSQSHESDACNFDRIWMEDEFTDTQLHDMVVLRGVNSLSESLDNRAERDSNCLITLIAYLSTKTDIIFIAELPLLRTQNTVASWIIQSQTEYSYPIWSAGIEGETEIIAVADTGVDNNSCFFTEENREDNIPCSTYLNPITDITKRKIVQYIGYADCYDSQGGHGTHVGGTLAGAQINTQPGHHIGDGVAFGAKLAVFDFGDQYGNLNTPSNLAVQMLQPAYLAGARVNSYSWGAVSDTYTGLDSQLDAWVYSNPDTVIVVAAGNCGDITARCQSRSGDFWGAGSILSPGLAKNVITVGSAESVLGSASSGGEIGNVAYFSSQGPTVGDGRIKPDLVAPGYNTFSPESNPNDPSSCRVASKKGTSMSAPVIAGAAALIRQYFIQGWYPTGKPNPGNTYNPTGALVKAMLINSAVSMSKYRGVTGDIALGDGPDGYQGWGRILLDMGLNVGGSVDLSIIDKIYVSDSSYSKTVMFNVRSNYSGEFRATMVFFEPASIPGAMYPVNNDIDLVVVGFNGTDYITFYPNGRTDSDTTNTVERVVVPNAENYEWFEVTVLASVITSSTESPFYALAVIGGQINGYQPGLSDYETTLPYILSSFTMEGSSVAEAGTENYLLAFALALEGGLGGYVSASGVELARLTSVEGKSNSANVLIKIATQDLTGGQAVMNYLLAVSDDTNSENSSLLTRFQLELSGRTIDGCVCAETQPDRTEFDCSTCSSDQAYSNVTSITLNMGDFNMYSTKFELYNSDSYSMANRFIANLIRTSSILYIFYGLGLVVVISIFGFVLIYYWDRKHQCVPEDCLRNFFPRNTRTVDVEINANALNGNDTET